MDALVMAGGRGTRLQPLTFSLPKPLLPVRDTPIIEIILRQLRRRGFTRVFVSVGHKGHLVRAFLTQLDLEGIEVSFLDETEPLGTAGPLRLLPADVDAFFLINGDILSTIDFGAVLAEHRAQDTAYMTAVVHHHAVTLPYGVLTLDGDLVSGIDEKPTLHFPVATGMYAFDRRAIEIVPPGRVDMPDIIKRLAADGRVRAHVMKEDWTDIADLADYEKVNLEEFGVVGHMTWRIPLADVRITAAQRAAVDAVLAGGWLSMGPRTKDFEAAFGAAVGIEHAVAVSNASTGLVAALQVVGVGPGDEVIVPSLTFVADANAIVNLGATPVFADIASPERPLVDPAAVQALVTDRTRAVLVVDYAGYAADIETLAPLRARGIAIVQDAAHAVGPADDDGRWIRVAGDVAVYSFFANKNLPLGEGGMIVTADEERATQLRLLRSHGMTALTWDRHVGRANDYDVVRPGWNFRPTEMASALGCAALPDLVDHNAARRAALDGYRKRFAGSAVEPVFGSDEPTTGHLAVVAVPAPARAAARAALRDAGVESSFHYPPIHTFSAYAASKHGSLAQTEAAATRLITLPLHPWLTDDELDLVAETLAGAVREAS